MTSEVEAIAKVEVGDGETEGITCRSTALVLDWVGLEPVSPAHPVTKAERQMIIKTAFLH